MRNITISMAIVAITLPALTHAWGDAAHRAIGLLTKKLLRPEISPRLEAVLALDPVTKGDFGAAAAWADTVVADPKYASTKELHYAQMTGTSPQQCSKIESDARPESGNVYGAIDTYTHKMLYDKDVQEREQNKTRPESIKFLFNFLTDIFQPMHITAEYNNGRDAKLYWKNSQASLHDIWDTHLVEERLREFNDQPALYA
ncbi:phospholipase C/P1 nuclease domain-containing protein, partial [Thamnocephalis sphaerospora]